MSAGTKDNLLDLISLIESQGNNYVIGIISEDKNDKSHEKIEVFTNLGDSSLDKLLKVLKEYKKSSQNKAKSDNIDKQD